VAKELVAKVNANEPGCMLMRIHHAETPETYVSWSAMADQAAVMPIGERSISRSSGVGWASSWRAGRGVAAP